MDCMQARLLLLFARPSEFAPDELVSLQDHLTQCVDCRSQARNEKQADELLGRVMCQVPPPSGLQNKILERLARDRKPRPWTWVAAAAAVLLAVGLGTGWYLRPLPILETDNFEKYRPGASPEFVAAWFRDQGLAVEVPPDFDFDFKYLDSYEVVSLQGRRVPKLLFLNSGAAAHVFVVSSREFRVGDDLAQALTANSQNAEIQHYPDCPDFSYLFIYSAGSRDSFPRRGI